MPNASDRKSNLIRPIINDRPGLECAMPIGVTPANSSKNRTEKMIPRVVHDVIRRNKKPGKWISVMY